MALVSILLSAFADFALNPFHSLFHLLSKSTRWAARLAVDGAPISRRSASHRLLTEVNPFMTAARMLFHLLTNVATVATLLHMKIAIREAKNNFSKYGNLAHTGNRITVCKNGNPWFDLVPHASKERSVKPLSSRPTISGEQAAAPVDAVDIEGWI